MAASKMSITSVVRRRSSTEKRVSIGSLEKTKDENNKKRISMIRSNSKDSNLKQSMSLLKDTNESENFPYDVHFEECFGIDDVVIEPTYMEFKDGIEGVTMKKTLTLKNFGSKAAMIIIENPHSLSLTLDTVQYPYRLYPGLSLKTVVSFVFKRPFSTHAQFPIEINGNSLDYHIIFTLSSSRISVDPLILDFENVDLGQVSEIKKLTLSNVGGKSAKFVVDTAKSEIDYMKVSPSMGIVKPGKKLTLSVQIKGREGIYKTELWIKSTPNICVTIVVNPIIPEIIVEYPESNAGCFSLINFPTTFLGTERLIKFKLKNTSSHVQSFTILNELNQKFTLVNDIDRTEDSTYDSFKLNILDGRLKPSEEVVLTITFAPTVQKLDVIRKLYNNRHVDYFVAAIKIYKLEAIEAREILKWKPVNDYNAERYLPKIYIDAFKNHGKKVRLDETIEAEATTIYLHGIIELPILCFDPDHLNLGKLSIDEKLEKIIEISNPSRELTIMFEFVSMPCVRCIPKKSTLRPCESIQVTICISVEFCLPPTFKLEFDLLGKTMIDDITHKFQYVKIARPTVPCTYDPILALPKAEISCHCICVCGKENGICICICVCKKVRKVCRVVSYELLPWKTDYDTYAYTPSELQLKLNNRNYWIDYYRQQARSRKNPKIDMIELHPDFSLEKYSKVQDLEKPVVTRSNKSDENDFSKTLTASEMYKITASPKKIKFGKVSNETTNYQDLTFENKNDFSVLISLICLTPDTVFFSKSDSCVLKSNSQHTFTIGFYASFFGKFSSYLHYTVNNNQKYQIGLEAFVVCKKLELLTTAVIFDKECLPQEGYRIPFKMIEIQNILNADTKFKFSLSANSNFSIEPDRGICTDSRRLCISVYHGLDPWKSNKAEALLEVEGGARATLKVELPIMSPNVTLLPETLPVDEIPLNIEHRSYAVLCNAEYFGVFFEIDETEIVDGIYVTPLRGYVPPRGILILSIYLKFDVCMQFSTTIEILIQKRLKRQLRISCSVTYPRLVLKPNVIDFERVNSKSYHVREISVKNLTNCKATIAFLFREYTEFRISYSELKIDEFIDEGTVIKIAPLETVKLFLHFIPCDLAKFSFYLPIVTNDILGPISKIGESLSPLRFLPDYDDEFYAQFQGYELLELPKKMPVMRIESTVSHPVISISKLLYEFNDRSSQEELRISNVTENKIKFTLNLGNLKMLSCCTPCCPFTITWTRGAKPNIDLDFVSFELDPEEYTRFEIKFTPTLPGKYLYELPIDLEIEDNVQTYNKIILKGELSKPCIDSDVLEIFFVPMPLRIMTKTNFTLEAYNFNEMAKIQFKIYRCEKLSGNYCDEQLKIYFPKGDDIKPSCKNEIEIDVEFRSYFTVSFCAHVTFYDSKNTASLTIKIYASADDSLLTIHLYKNTIGHNFSRTKEQKYPHEMNLIDQRSDKVAEADSSSSGSSNESAKKNQVEFKEDRRPSALSYKSGEPARPDFLSDFDLASVVSDRGKYNIGCYPFFPIFSLLIKKKVHLYRTLKAAELWVYASALSYQFNPKLPAGMTAVLSGVLAREEIGSNKNGAFIPCSFIEVLEFLVGPEKITDLDISLDEDDIVFESLDPNEQREKVLNIYRKIMNFLMSKGANIAHISPEFLLNYYHYKKLKEDSDELLMEHVFESRCTQSWLDLILQSYKCFVLSKVNQAALTEQASLMEESKKIETFSCKQDLNVQSIMHMSQKYEQMSKSEAILLAWLEYHCNNFFDARTVDNFEDCLSDGLVFIAVTITYCPFIEEDFFKDIYQHPEHLEERVHNANCLVTAWKKIRLGFIVNPTDIINPNCIQMLMLTVHLFQHLPTYLIRKKVEFSCPLTESSSKQINLSVESQHQIKYVVQFFGNDLDTFFSKPILTLKPEKKTKVKVTYYARKIMKIKVYMIVCGSSIGPHCPENRTFVLEGFPDELVISNVYPVRSKLYKIVERKLSISIPYTYKTQYEIWLSYEQPQKYDELKITSWSELKLTKAPRRLLFKEDFIEVEEENDTQTVEFAFFVSCMVAEPRSFWIVFRSQMADFIIQINSIYQTSVTNQHEIELTYDDCICPGVANLVVGECPLNKQIVIPAKNSHLLDCVLHMYHKSLDSEEKVYWADNLDNCIGLRIMKWLMRIADDSITQEYKHIYKSAVLYKINANKNNVITKPRHVVVEDTKYYENIDMCLHITPNKIEEDDDEEEIEKKKLRNARLTLTSSDKKEIRVCDLNFVYESSESSKIEKQ